MYVYIYVYNYVYASYEYNEQNNESTAAVIYCDIMSTLPGTEVVKNSSEALDPLKTFTNEKNDCFLLEKWEKYDLLLLSYRFLETNAFYELISLSISQYENTLTLFLTRVYGGAELTRGGGVWLPPFPKMSE